MEYLGFLNNAIVPRVKMTRLSAGLRVPPGAAGVGHTVQQPVLRISRSNSQYEQQQNSGTVAAASDADYFSEAESNQEVDEEKIDHIASPKQVDSTVTGSCENKQQQSQSQLQSQSKNADDSFCDIIRNILVAMPEGETKDMVKLKIHQQVLEAKYKLLNR